MTSNRPYSVEPRDLRRLAQRKAREQRRGHDYAAIVAYDGTRFHGYARQPGLPTVEGALREALVPVVPGFRRMAVAGRTDRGVSATAQVVSFRSDERLSVDSLVRAIDDAAPGALMCRGLQQAPRGFHAQFWATERRYLYLHPASAEESGHWALADELLRHLVGRRCLSAFARETYPGQNTVRTLLTATCRLGHLGTSPTLVFNLAADGFLRRSVRVMVATALEHARRGSAPDTLLHLAASGKRLNTEFPAPPEYLRLARIRYRDWTPF